MADAQQLQPAQQSQLPQQLPQNASLYKNQLQQYAQRAGLGLPVYHTKNMGQPHAGEFKCSVTVDDETYESPNTFSQKKAAEQDAAKHALQCIFEKRKEKGSSIINKFRNTALCKAILHEYAAKLQTERPKYTTVKTQQVPLPVFVSTLEFRGVSYTGGPARTKRDAEQLVAHDVMISILGNSEEDSTLLEILLSKAKLFSDSELSTDPSCVPRPGEGSNSAGGGDSITPFVSEGDVMTPNSNEDQLKDANKSPVLQMEGVSCPQIQIPSPADVSVSTVPPSSQNPATPIQIPPPAEVSVSIVPPSSQLNLTTPIQELANEVYETTPATQAHGSVSLTPQSSQNQSCGVSSGLPQNVANQICEIRYVLVDKPQNLTAPLQSFAPQGCEVVTCATPQVIPSAVAPIQDCSVSCASQSTEGLSLNQRKQVKKRARMDNQ